MATDIAGLLQQYNQGGASLLNVNPGLSSNPALAGQGATGKLANSFQMALQGAGLQTGTKPVIPGLAKIGEADVSRFNRTNFDELGKMVREANPYFDTQAAQLNKNITADLQGVLPQDVVDRYRNLAAASHVGSGQSQRDTTTLRDLGLTSLQRMDQGFNKSLQFGDFMKNQLVPNQQLMTPELAAQQEASQFDRNLLANETAAAADPAKAALGKVLETYAGLLASRELTESAGGIKGFASVSSGLGGAMSSGSSTLDKIASGGSGIGKSRSQSVPTLRL